MLISVIIPTYNRAALLARTVAAFAAQRLEEHSLEIIVVNDGSTDATASCLETFQARFENVRALHQENAGRAAARNRGIEVAGGEVLLFSDDDMVPADDDFVNRHILAQKVRPAAYVSRLVIPDEVVKTPFQAYWRRHLQAGNASLPEGRMLGRGGFWFAALSIPSDLLGSARFSTAFRGYGWEDLELGYRLYRRGVRPYYLKSAEIYHEDQVDFASHCAKYYAMGRSAWTFYRLHPKPQVALWTGVHPLVRVYKKLAGLERRADRLKKRPPEMLSDKDYALCLEAAYARGVNEARDWRKYD